ncbi:D-arabinono-1,4-lactone oxidase [Microbacterium sp. Marseille-Q6965]|uniref:D-arabinono-1,4-lactone oxidase n=1 Tax=Microbacterium sp. Marseille-Q6965 TaxID=2965072 RepID=UPI0021B7555B|nr:D-arabinono-1,4-lactone oxidase [Microbacterium sp. Marseille-Q6965]
MSAAEANWAGNIAYRAQRVLRPVSLDELRDALAGSPRARVLGTRHSFNDIADTDGVQISLAHMPREIETLPDAVRVSAALRYGDLAPAIHARGLALANLASLPHISVAGSVATGTHGSGDALRSLSASVRALTLMTADGEIVSVRRGDADFAGAVVSLGALGVVTSLELDAEPSYRVAQEVFEGPRWDDVLARFDEVTALGDSVSLFTTWSDADVARQLWVKRRVPATGLAPVDPDLIAAVGAVPAAGPRHPVPGVDAAACSVQGGEPGPWFERLPHFRLEFTPSAGDELQSEFLVARADGAAAIEALRAIARDLAPALHVSEVRTVAADDLWLSPSGGRDSVALHFTWKRDVAAAREAVATVERVLAPFGARPHWGKIFGMAPERIAALYPRWADFRALRERMDPRGVFRNAFVARLGL